jgi:hypothetical protein
MTIEVVFTGRLISRIVKNNKWVYVSFLSGNELFYYTKNGSPFEYISCQTDIEEILKNKYAISDYNKETNHEIVRDQILPKPQLR